MHLRDYLGLLGLLLTLVRAQPYYTPTPSLPKLDRRPRFVLYNPFNGQQLEPLRYVALLRGNKQINGNIVELPQLWQPCSCSEYTCRCCLGLVFGLGEAFNQRVCTSIVYNRADLGLQLSIELNQRSVANFGFSARNPPDYCVPLLVPLPLFSCLRLYDIRVFGEGNVQICISVVFKVLVSQFFEYRFNCVRFGSNGVYFVQLQDEVQEVELTTTKGTHLPNDKLASGYHLDLYRS